MMQRVWVTLTGVSLILLSTSGAAETGGGAKAEFQKQDTELNRAYQEAIGKLSPPEQEQLKKYQRAWIASRDKEAGTVPAGSDRWKALTESTKSRVDFLKHFGVEDGAYPPPGLHEVKEEGKKRGPDVDFTVKDFQNEDGEQWQTWVVSKKDRAQHRRLPAYRDSTGFSLNGGGTSSQNYVSPDGRWIFRYQQDNSDYGSGYLYKRKDGVAFERATDSPIDELAWRFFEKSPANQKTYKLSVSIDGEDQGMDKRHIAFEAWSGDGKKLRLSLSGIAHHRWDIDDWQCDYDLETGTFEAPPALAKHNAKAVEKLE